MVASPMISTQHTTRQRPLDFVRLASEVDGNETASGVRSGVRIRRWGWKYLGDSVIRVEIPQGIYTVVMQAIGASSIRGDTGATLRATSLSKMGTWSSQSGE